MSETAMQGKPGVYRICEARELESLTMQGWRIVQPIADSVVLSPVTQYDRIDRWRDHGRNENNSIEDAALKQSHVASRVRFLLHKSDDSIVVELNGQIDAEKRCNNDLREKHYKLTEELAKAAKISKEIGEERDNLRKANADMARSVIELRDRCRLMEVDLGKIREAIGKIRMDEILGKKGG